MQANNAKAATPREAGAARSPTNRLEHTTRRGVGASQRRRFGPNLGEAIILALAIGAGRPR